jgi:hypothetical protein
VINSKAYVLDSCLDVDEMLEESDYSSLTLCIKSALDAESSLIKSPGF